MIKDKFYKRRYVLWYHTSYLADGFYVRLFDLKKKKNTVFYPQNYIYMH